MKYESVIGIEVHAQLSTHSKLFCRCKLKSNAPENTLVCPVCLGHPGTLPSVNKEAVNYAVKLASALGCKINKISEFSRKNYFYPDLPKGYQITQHENPIASGGFVNLGFKKVPLERLHLEEDSGKNIHREGKTLIDFNRAGIPLVEIVSKPELRSSEEAYCYLKNLYQILTYLEICDGNMELGNFRCEANVSVRPRSSEMGVPVELKNINSFKFVQKAIDFEIQRQTELLEAGDKVERETRGYDEGSNSTFLMRKKFKSSDYRYFPEPDLPKLLLDVGRVDNIKSDIPELPYEKTKRFVKDYDLPEYDARHMSESIALANFFESAALGYSGEKRRVSSFILSELFSVMKSDRSGVKDIKFGPEGLSSLLEMVDDGTISTKISKKVLKIMYESGADPQAIVEEKNLKQISDAKEIEKIVDKILIKYNNELLKYKAGHEKVFDFFVGEVMKVTLGKASPKIVNKVLGEKLKD